MPEITIYDNSGTAISELLLRRPNETLIAASLPNLRVGSVRSSGSLRDCNYRNLMGLLLDCHTHPQPLQRLNRFWRKESFEYANEVGTFGSVSREGIRSRLPVLYSTSYLHAFPYPQSSTNEKSGSTSSLATSTRFFRR